MSGVGKVRTKLQDLVGKFDQFLPVARVESILKAYNTTRRTTLRLNRLRVKGRQAEDAVLGSIQEKLQELSSRTRPTRLERCPWNEDAYIISPPNVQVKHLIDLSPHKQGLFHFQSWSSIIPPLCIEYGRGQNLLDMCAAPGGKASMIAEKMEGDSRLVVNEKDRKRYEKMSFVLSQLVPEDMMCRLSLRNCDARKFRLVETGTEASTEDLQSGSKYNKIISQAFDAILLDAPCSGEGIISMEVPGSYKNWSLQWIADHVALQRQLLTCAVSLLKKGGQLVYSTCTVNPDENEENVSWMLRSFPGLSVENLPPPFKVIDNGFREHECFARGLAGSLSDVQAARCLRVYPSETMEGFFVCKLRKN